MFSPEKMPLPRPYRPTIIAFLIDEALQLSQPWHRFNSIFVHLPNYAILWATLPAHRV